MPLNPMYPPLLTHDWRTRPSLAQFNFGVGIRDRLGTGPNDYRCTSSLSRDDRTLLDSAVDPTRGSGFQDPPGAHHSTIPATVYTEAVGRMGKHFSPDGCHFTGSTSTDDTRDCLMSHLSNKSWALSNESRWLNVDFVASGDFSRQTGCALSCRRPFQTHDARYPISPFLAYRG